MSKEKELSRNLTPYVELLESELNRYSAKVNVPLFYDPINYVLQIPGKRIRPLLVMLSAEALGKEAKDARFAAAAVELLHNFTLVHDDIMDNDEMRRGQLTVHKKWDLETAILAGDGLMGLAFLKLLESPGADIHKMATRFTETMLQICEGQGLDKMFESGTSASSQDYLGMIARKTAVLLELSCQLGAMVAGADENRIRLLGNFGYELGMGFQIQDDWLDILGEEQSLGKKLGSDLERHKQTILILKLREKYPKHDLFSLSLEDFRILLRESGVAEEVKERFEKHYDTAFEMLSQLPDSKARRLLRELSGFIRARQW